MQSVESYVTRSNQEHIQPILLHPHALTRWALLEGMTFFCKDPPHTHTQNCKQATNAVLSFKYTSHLSLYEHKSLQVKIYFTVNVKR